MSAPRPPAAPRRWGSAPPDAPAAHVIAPAALQQQADLRLQQAMATLISNRDFGDVRFRMNNFFEYYRRGLALEYMDRGDEPWDDALRDPTKALVAYDPQAPPADWNSIYNDAFGNDERGIRAQQAANMDYFEAPEPGFIRPRYDTGVEIAPMAPGALSRKTEADDNWSKDAYIISIRRAIRARGLDIRTLRHLGAGGQGLATLFEVRSSRGGVRRKFVVKTSSKVDDPGLQYEKFIQRRLRRAPHVVRSLLWADDILTSGPLTQDTRLFCEDMDDHNEVIFLEFLKGGNLADLIGKAVAAGAVFPNGVLWKVFFCLVRACLAMEYPPRLLIQENGELLWGPETGEDGVERVPDHRREGYRLVHFDLDPRNVMIGDNDGKHPAVPIFKVGDFGVAAVARNPNPEERDRFWLSRRVGKVPHLLPEQFHKEWEYVRNLPHEENPVPKVAGNFGPGSNIWAIGMVLHDMITGNYAPYPPAAFGPMNGPDAAVMPDGIPMFRDVDGNVVDPFYTHGGWIRNADNIDNDLKGLLMRCLADQPANRPTLQELNTYLDKADRIFAWNEDPDDREWFERVVNEPPDAVEMIDPALDLTAAEQFPGLPAIGLSPLRSVLRTGTRISNLISAAGARLQALSVVSGWPGAKPPQPPPSDDSAWLFNSNMDSLALNFLGVAVANPAPDAAERAADRLNLSTPARPWAGPGRRLGSAPGPSPLSSFLSSLTRTNRTRNTAGTQSNAYLSGNASTPASSVDDAPNIFLTPQDPATPDGNGLPAGIARGIVLPLSGGLSARDLIPIPPLPAPPEGYRYGRASPVAPLDGQVVPAGMFTIRIDPADPAQGGVPNIFYRELGTGGGVAKPRDNAADNDPDGGGRRLPPGDGRGPWVPKVKAIRIPPYGLFERPPPRPRGYHYGRRLYLSPADIQSLADRGITAPRGRMIIRLVHVNVAEGDSYERPTIFYQIEPRARAPRPPSDHDAEPNILYCTLPIL